MQQPFKQKVYSVYDWNYRLTANIINAIVEFEKSPNFEYYFEVLHGQSQPVLNEIKPGYKVNIIDSIYSYEQIQIIDKSDFVLNLCQMDSLQKTLVAKYHKHGIEPYIVYTGNFMFSSYITLYFLKNSGFSQEKAIDYILGSLKNNKFLELYCNNLGIKPKKEYMIEDQEAHIKNLNISFKQNLRKNLLHHEYLIKKRQQEQSMFSGFFKKQVTMEEVQDLKQQYQYFINKSNKLCKHMLDSNELEELKTLMKETHIKDLKEKLLENIILTISSRNPIIINQDDSKLEFTEVLLRKNVSIYFDKLEDTANHAIKAFNDVEVEQIEVPKCQYDHVIQMINATLHLTKRISEKKKIICSSFNYQQIKFLIEVEYIPQQYIVKGNNFYSETQKYLLSTKLQMELLKLKKFSLSKIQGIVVLDLLTRVGETHIYRQVAKHLGRKNLNLVFNNPLDFIAKLFPKNYLTTIMSTIFKHPVQGAAAMTSFRKLLRTNLVVSLTQDLIFSVHDTFSLFKGVITPSEYIKELSSQALSTALSAKVAIASLAIPGAGPFVAPIASVTAKVISQKLSKSGFSLLYKSPEEKVIQFVENWIEQISAILSKEEKDKTIITFRKLHGKYIVERYFKDNQKSEVWKLQSKLLVIDFLKREFKKRSPNQINLNDFDKDPSL